MAWEIEFSEKSKAFLDRLEKSDRKSLLLIYDKLVAFSKTPRLFGKPLVGDKQGLWRYRVGNYRILCYLLDDRLLILVLVVDHRKDVYK